MNQDKLGSLLEVGGVLSDGNEEADKNLFEMANLKEYRHSAILGYLLGRKEQGKKVHLASFCNRLFGGRLPCGKFDDAVEVLCEEWVDCPNGKRPIDILIKTNDFSLIIENKCRGAHDQDAQICDYWDGVKKCGFPEENIYVLYLPPMNTFSAPSDASIGIELKQRFSAKGDLAGHLITCSYRDLILPWLKEDVLPNICYGSGVLADSLSCYIDLLEGMFAVRASSRDARIAICKKFGEWIGQSDSGSLWKSATDCLGEIDEVLSDKTQNVLAEKEANLLGTLQSKLWEVRSVLREHDPLLDPSNLTYEVYWLLRKNPTPFASQYIRFKLESGLFFQTGRKQSTWDSVEYDGHWLECCFHVDEFVKYCKGKSCGTILTFGIGNVNESDCKQLKEAYREYEYLTDSKWLTIFTVNVNFGVAKGLSGGVLLWSVAETVASECKRFSDAIKSFGMI